MNIGHAPSKLQLSEIAVVTTETWDGTNESVVPVYQPEKMYANTVFRRDYSNKQIHLAHKNGDWSAITNEQQIKLTDHHRLFGIDEATTALFTVSFGTFQLGMSFSLFAKQRFAWWQFLQRPNSNNRNENQIYRTRTTICRWHTPHTNSQKIK